MSKADVDSWREQWWTECPLCGEEISSSMRPDHIRTECEATDG